jgi:hypothetical protein
MKSLQVIVFTDVWIKIFSIWKALSLKKVSASYHWLIWTGKGEQHKIELNPNKLG